MYANNRDRERDREREGEGGREIFHNVPLKVSHSHWPTGVFWQNIRHQHSGCGTILLGGPREPFPDPNFLGKAIDLMSVFLWSFILLVITLPYLAVYSLAKKIFI